MIKNQQRKRLIVAVLLSPLAMPVGAGLAVLIDALIGTGIYRVTTPLQFFQSVLIVSIFGIPIALAAVLLLALPVRYFLRFFGVSAHWPYALFGLVGGLAIGACMDGLSNIKFDVIGASGGLAVSITFSFFMNRELTAKNVT